ncbi:MAG TPA: choice-of-anchor B family protein, partial [Bacteroidota bacterium]|nr:choice-of-anchor B family protein [Bacteroidota bacterium]
MKSKQLLLNIFLLCIIFYYHKTLSQESGAVRFLGHFISPSGGEYVAGCWGWTDTTTGREYALLGNECGTSIVEITNSDNLVERDFIPGVCSSWREIQTHSHYAYVVSEGGQGTQIIDLSTLPDSARLVKNFTYTQGTRNTSRSHSIHIKDGYMYLNGCGNWSPGGIVIFSLADPENPTFQSAFVGHYIHDSFARNNTIYGAAIYGVGIDIIDVTTKTSPQLLYTITYPGAGTHNCATTDDGQFLLTTDEINSTPKTLKIWDLRNPPSFPKVAEYQGDPTATVHNVFVKGNLAFMSYYTAGLRIVDISDPTQPIEVGGYDTYPGTGGGYTGAWSTYPFFPSGKVIIGDMVSGMYLVDLNANAPKVPSNFRAHSDYLSPTSISLTWNDPETFVSGSPLSNFKIHIYVEDFFIAEVDSGIEMYIDTGLVNHQLYRYRIRTVTAEDSSTLLTQKSYAGGAAEPSPPTNFTVFYETDGVSLSWKNPSTQIDGTPLNDIGYVDIFRDGKLHTSLPQTTSDTGQYQTYLDSIHGYHLYALSIRDNEIPENISEFTDSLIAYGGVNNSYTEDFESGKRDLFVNGTWDTTQTIAYSGLYSLTDSPMGNYTDNSKTYFITPPVVINSSMVLRFKHIAI